MQLFVCRFLTVVFGSAGLGSTRRVWVQLLLLEPQLRNFCWALIGGQRRVHGRNAALRWRRRSHKQQAPSRSSRTCAARTRTEPRAEGSPGSAVNRTPTAEDGGTARRRGAENFFLNGYREREVVVGVQSVRSWVVLALKSTRRLCASEPLRSTV